MRVLVMPHDLAIGGSQINAIDLAAGVAKAGHEVVVFGVRGPLVDIIHERGLEFVDAHSLSWRPAPTRIAQLVALARRRRIDVIHTYEWSTCLDAYFGPHLCLGVPLLCTVLSMSATPMVPPSVPLVMGTKDLGTEARRLQKERVWVLEPPIDTERDNPAMEGSPFRRDLGIAEDEFLIVTVSRLSLDIKIDALVRAVDAMEELASDIPIRLAIVGGGQASDALRARAEALNRRVGRDVIVFAGPWLDPRTAYAAADLVLGMGSSALRALAIGRPLIVQGLNAFSVVFGPDTLPVFLRQGFFGEGECEPGAGRLARQIAELYRAPARREALGAYGRSVVTERFSLARGIDLTLQMYRDVLRTPPRRNLIDAFRGGWRALKLEVENHDPRQKRRLAAFEHGLLDAARSESWPPQALR
ncbi:glycosyltransferase [uncultured Paracoccus sp.]|uniref:glycosyltransferase n=1 Tax=uncultured Paracoccus sp. TaxID=189685 RepID=UPI00261DFE33|nr:glycosyltransferase [uncultured Paracoccus sp.]